MSEHLLTWAMDGPTAIWHLVPWSEFRVQSLCNRFETGLCDLRTPTMPPKGACPTCRVLAEDLADELSQALRPDTMQRAVVMANGQRRYRYRTATVRVGHETPYGHPAAYDLEKHGRRLAQSMKVSS